MAKYEGSIKADFDELLSAIENGVVNSSATAALEDRSDFRGDNSRCSVRVFERYSYTGGNRVSLSVTLFQESGGDVQVSAIASGGSTGVVFKINVFCEEAFLEKLTDMVEFLIPNYIQEGKTQLVIAVGCTGGKHRSVTLANALYQALSKHENYGIRIEHRDIGKDAVTKAK